MNQPQPKSPFASKTVWVNLALAIAGLLQASIPLLSDYPATVGHIITIIGVINIALRFLTGEPITAAVAERVNTKNSLVLMLCALLVLGGATSAVADADLPKLTTAPLKVPDQPPALPVDFTYQIATDGESYALSSYALVKNIRGWEGVNIVAVGGWRVRDYAGATGFGAEIERTFDQLFVKAGIYAVTVQGEKWRGLFGVSGGIRF